MAPYKTHCDNCDMKFTTTTALLKHRTSKHHSVRRVKQLPFYNGETIISVPKPYTGAPSATLFRDYKLWLSGVAESMTSTLHPKVSGKWMKVERFDCPVDFLKLMLTHLTSAFVNKVGERPHWRPPVWKRTAQQISWKCFEMEEVNAVFESGLTPLVITKSFNGEREVADMGLLSGASAIALAKAKARKSNNNASQQPTCRASLVVGEGEGRATREFEVIWWPDMYMNQQRGKLTLRYYVGKVMFTN